jgi:2-polyprenyl-6-methoxyphenol hydroxylase-like FAD-dependent oxidoreductase
VNEAAITVVRPEQPLLADILVVGAGPAGLALALQAHDHGAVVRIIDRRPEAARPSRALILHSRTLEVLRPLGVTGALLARADIAPTADLRLGSRVVRVTLGGLALPDTAFPHLSLVRQMDVERVLAQALADRGVQVERGTELAGVHDEPGGVRAVLRSAAGPEEARFGFTAGCDGAASTVRAQAGLGWTGRPYPAEIVLADAELDGDLAGDAAQVTAGRGGLLFAFRLGEKATWRLLGTRPAAPDRLPPGSFGPPVSAADLQELMDAAGLDARLTGLAWSARVRVQRRVASRFRQGRLFLAGDAAHAYSPATGQGMNAAIQDAANLGWKLAFAARQCGPEQCDGPLLDSYDRERRPVARQVLALTNLAFWAEAGTGPVPSALRARLAPLAAPLAPALVRGRLAAGGIRLLSQLCVSYRDSPLSIEGTPRRRGGPRAGDRLPDRLVRADGRSLRLHELLARPGVHVLLDRDADRLDAVRLGRFVPLTASKASPGMASPSSAPMATSASAAGPPRPVSLPPGSTTSASATCRDDRGAGAVIRRMAPVQRCIRRVCRRGRRWPRRRRPWRRAASGRCPGSGRPPRLRAL